MVVELVVVVVGGVAFIVAPGAKKDRKATALSGTKQNGHFRHQCSIDFGAGMVHLKPEWPIFGTGKGQKSTHRKIVKHFPLF